MTLAAKLPTGSVTGMFSIIVILEIPEMNRPPSLFLSNWLIAQVVIDASISSDLSEDIVRFTVLTVFSP